MSEPKKLTVEGVVDQASAAALFYRTLIDQGVPSAAAISMAGQYVVGQCMAEMSEEKPTQPWEEPDK